jgi:EAL domain-containing protein (putative c-di-GMP-specific phosphodiesterase class I)/FixJ family two-component response regulator
MSNPPPASTDRPGSSGRLAFVLDDEPQIRAIAAKILESIGFVARQFAAPLPMLDELKRTPPEVILLDVALGQSDAVEVIRHLESAAYKGKVMLISGGDYVTLNDIQHIGEQHGLAMAPPVQKPFRASDITASLAVPIEPHAPHAKAGAQPLDWKEQQRRRIDPAEALRNNWLRLWYQAKIDLKSMTVSGAEALLRANHPEFGLINPLEFLPARSSSMYQPLTKFVVMQAKADWENFAAQGQALKLSINVPLSTLQSPAFVELIRSALPRKPNYPGMIVEVSEGEALTDLAAVREVATQLKLYNVALSIDDFGNEHSSLARLRDLPFVELKLDRSYVSGCATDSAKQSVLVAAMDLAHGFGLTVCAKGVETVDDLRTVMELGCHSAQGFLFAQPMGSGSFIKMLLGRSETTAKSAQPQAAGANLKLTA